MITEKVVGVGRVEQMEVRESGPLTEWENEPSIKDLKADLLIAQPEHDSQVSKIKGWLDARNAEGRYKPRKIQNRSSVQPKLIRRQNEWRYSALSEPFNSSKDLFDITGRTFEDVESARKNQLILNYQFTTQLNRTKLVDNIVHSAVDTGTCVARLSWDRQTKMVQKEQPVLNVYALDEHNPEQVAMLQQAMDLYENNRNEFLNLPIEAQESVLGTLENGFPVIAIDSGEVELVEEEKIVRNQPAIDILDYEDVYIDPTAKGDLAKANFAVITFETSKAELLKDGRYTNLKDVNWADAAPINHPEHGSSRSDQVQFKDEARKRVLAYEYWGNYDIHGTGELVPIVATWVGNTMIRMEENPFPDQKIPLVIIPYMPIINKLAGEPDAELLIDNQAVLGALARGMIDLLGRSANGQTGFAKGMLDRTNRHKYNQGMDYEFNPNMAPQQGMFTHTYPEIPNSALTMLTLQNQEAESLTGVKAFSGGLSGEAYGDVAAGIRGMLDASAKREMSILRRFAEGVCEIGRKVMMMNQAFLSEEEVVRITNDTYETVRLEDLAGEFDMKVDISTAEIDAAQAEDLSFMLQTMGNNMDFNMTKLILAKIARLKRMPDLAEQIERFEPQPDPFTEQMKQIELQKAQLELQEMQSKIALNEAKARSEHSDADKADLDFVETESGTKHARDIDKISQQAQSNQKLELTKANLQSGEDRPSKAQMAEESNRQQMQAFIDRMQTS